MTLRFAVNCSILFTELPLLERPAAARAAGFDAVEFWWPFPVAVPPGGEVDAFAAAVRDAGVRLVGLNFFAGDMPAGDRGLVSWPDRSAEFRANVEATAALGERLGCRAFNALYGNRVDVASAEEQDALAVENLALAAEAVGRFGGVVLVEACSGAPRYPLQRAADALAVVDRARQAGAGNVAFLADLYHLAVGGDDLAAVIAAHGAGFGHVQVADAPGRGEPGSGQLDLDRHLAALERTGYAGWVGLEYTPTTATTADSLGWLPRERRTAHTGEEGAP